MKLNINLTCHVYRNKKNAKNNAFSLFICKWFQLSARSCPKIPVSFSIEKKTAFMINKLIKTCHSSWATNITRPQRNKVY